MKLCLIFSLIATVFVAEAKTAKFNCTIRQCNQCATVFYERVGSQLQQKFCGRFLSRGCCRLDNSYGRLFWKGFSEFYDTSSCNKKNKIYTNNLFLFYQYFINILSKFYCSMTDRKMVMQYAATRARIVIKKRNLSCMSK